MSKTLPFTGSAVAIVTPFDGYKTNFEDGGLFMYHPAERSHHNGEYYKISVGKKGVRRFDRNGKRIIKSKKRT